MLTICSDQLPQTSLVYLAFRVAFEETLERIVLAQQMEQDTGDCFGFLTEVPFLRAVPAHVQLDLLAETWHKHISDERFDASLVDESVVYAACETAARVVEEDAATFQRYVEGGPLDVSATPDDCLASELRALHLNLANEGDFLLVSQFEDMLPDEAKRLKKKLGIDESRLESLFDVLGRWSVSADFLMNLSGLMSKHEVVRCVYKLGVK